MSTVLFTVSGAEKKSRNKQFRQGDSVQCIILLAEINSLDKGTVYNVLYYD